MIPCKLTPPKRKLLFALYIVNFKQKIFQLEFFLTFFFRFRLHLVRGFQTGITLGFWRHISFFGWVVGCWRVGGCGWGWVAEHKTPSDIPFWIPLNKCSLNLKKKVKKFQAERFLFLNLLCKLRKVICAWEGSICMESKNSFSNSYLYMSEVPGFQLGAS